MKILRLALCLSGRDSTGRSVGFAERRSYTCIWLVDGRGSSGADGHSRSWSRRKNRGRPLRSQGESDWLDRLDDLSASNLVRVLNLACFAAGRYQSRGTSLKGLGGSLNHCIGLNSR
jgi:hypothetical protein